MKKFLGIIVILLISLILSSCKNNDYALVEISAEDLLKNIESGDKEFIFAVTNDEKQENSNFLDDLKKIVQNDKVNIYYLDYNHTDGDSVYSLLENYNVNLTSLTYNVYIKKFMAVSKYYSNYDNMERELKKYNYSDKLTETSIKELKDNLDSAKTLYREGKIGESFNKLHLAWKLDDAKNFYRNNKYYNLIHVWEVYSFKDSSLTELTYKSIVFIKGNNYYYEATIKGLYKDFKKPEGMDGFKKVYYYIKDDIIYTSYTESDYKEKYHIDNIDAFHFDVTEIRTNNKYNFIRGD